jgi:hypothetical protein
MPHTIHAEECRAGFRLALFVEEVFGAPVAGVVRSCNADYVTVVYDAKSYRLSYDTVFLYPAVFEQTKFQFRFLPPGRSRDNGRRRRPRSARV